MLNYTKTTGPRYGGRHSCSYVTPPRRSECTTRPPMRGCARESCRPGKPGAATRSARATSPRPDIRVRDWAVQADRLHAAIMSGDETLARHIFDRLARGVPLTELCERVISPALYRIGEDWADGETTIAAEHRASAICERLIAARTGQPQGRPRGIAVVSTPPGERHGLPALMATACLREDRWLVHHLAADLPVTEVTGLARLAGASLVVLSCATAESARRARDAADEITRSAAGLHVLTGQPGEPLSRLRPLARAAASEGGGDSGTAEGGGASSVQL